MRRLILITCLIFSVLACSGEGATSDPVTDKEPVPKVQTGETQIPTPSPTPETPTTGPIELKPTPTVSSVGAKDSTKIPPVTPTATPMPAKATAPTPTAPTPTATLTPAPTPTSVARAGRVPKGPAPTFSPSTQFGSFESSVAIGFQQAINNEFVAAVNKAGVSAAVFDGSKLWTGALGDASSIQAMTANTPMIIRSTSKTFLGALIASQIDQGLYRLSDTVADLLTDHPDYDLINIDYVNTAVTVEQLLTMTSGIYDWSAESDLQKRMEIMLTPDWNPAYNLSKISKPFVPPGSYRYSYANSILIGLIAEHLSGKTINTLYQEVFFEPLGISGALLPDVVAPLNLAKPHDNLANYGGGTGFGDLEAGSMAMFAGKDPRISWAGAGIVSTPQNIARWGYELFSSSGKAVTGEVRGKLIGAMKVQTDAGMTSLGMHTYGYYMGEGEVTTSDGLTLKAYTHPGGGGGRTSWLYYSPELDVSISLLANSMFLHDLGSCGYKGFAKFMAVGECMAGGMFSLLQGKPIG